MRFFSISSLFNRELNKIRQKSLVIRPNSTTKNANQSRLFDPIIEIAIKIQLIAQPYRWGRTCWLGMCFKNIVFVSHLEGLTFHVWLLDYFDYIL